MQVARAGLTLTGSSQYNLYADLNLSYRLCDETSSASASGEEVESSRESLSLGVYDEWPGIPITLSAFLQIREVTWWGGSLVCELQ